MTSSQTHDSPVYAAGALVWRQDGDEIETLVIHRSFHGDYSLPKGKVDDDETLPETAAREVWEETGFRVALGVPLSLVEYELPGGRPKEVHYWACEVTRDQWEGHKFEPNDEVDRLEWMSLDRAEQELTYVRDRELIGEFRELARLGRARTFPVILLRHAKAVASHAWTGEDETRPLTARGQAQSAQIVPILESYAPVALVTSTAVRCRATVAPFAQAAAIVPESTRILSQSAAPLDGEIRDLVAEAIAPGVGTVFCSHSPVMPELVAAVAQLTRTSAHDLARRALLSTAEASIFHVRKADLGLELVAAETFGPLI
ncbi:NUDIX hydrolase [Gulosibacter molinativorax]|uniref:NUDIX hydrolase n=1 Tax=Gulosibacter molinativorax TaxID=256821 RepID=A0ABT7C423_9MICO|nr:NUDIX domain-containing protein [Gulosibacter molinativorax]MDJ1369966.1 NUDIX hydrolase [Gulosibacter molinativorax]QUY63844.1 Diadenosine hexaphosphate hydrolase [Gulosibacter molinativorax]